MSDETESFFLDNVFILPCGSRKNPWTYLKMSLLSAAWNIMIMITSLALWELSHMFVQITCSGRNCNILALPKTRWCNGLVKGCISNYSPSVSLFRPSPWCLHLTFKGDALKLSNLTNHYIKPDPIKIPRPNNNRGPYPISTWPYNVGNKTYFKGFRAGKGH